MPATSYLVESLNGIETIKSLMQKENQILKQKEVCKTFKNLLKGWIYNLKDSLTDL